MNSAPDRPEATLQFTLRKSTRKTVTPGKDFSLRQLIRNGLRTATHGQAQPSRTPLAGGFRSN